MKNLKKFLLTTFVIFTLIISVFSVINLARAEDPIIPDPTPILGCMDTTATNYNPLATQDDSSCTYPPEEILSVQLTIRDGSSILFNNSIDLQPAGTTTLNGHNLNSRSVLSVLNDADVLSENFQITDLQYYDSFGSFYLKCINSKCDNWQYTINDSYYQSGMDQTSLSGGENIYIYFSPQHQFSLSSNSIATTETLTVTARNYVYQNNTWESLVSKTIGVTQPDPNNPWSPTEIQTNQTDGNGKAIFSGLAIGTYNVGIQEDFYVPSETLTVIQAQTSTTSGSSTGSGGGNGSGVIIKKTTFDYEKALDYLASQQKSDNTFGAELYTDWAALSFASSSDEKYTELKNKLIKYFSENKFSGTSLTDFERHAIALMSLNLNPYNINNTNYIEKISSFFNNQSSQFGDENLDTDDIFALIVLQNAGFTESDLQISKTIDFILSKQKENGSWDENVDITSAGIAGLVKFTKDNKNSEKISSSLNKAKEYLKSKQDEKASWENVSSASWAINSILSLSEKVEDWQKNNTNPLDYLAEQQEPDGSIKILATENLETKIWKTSYAATAASGKTWNQIMHEFPKQEFQTTNTNQNQISQNLANSNQAKFIQKVEKFQKPANQNPVQNLTQNTEIIPTETQNKEQKTAQNNWFRKILNLAKFLFS